MTPAGRAARRDGFLAAIRQAPAIMGILNVTPDSFSDGGRHLALGAAMAQARAMGAAGAAILDIGGESTRPGFTPVVEAEELARVAPVLAALGEAMDIPVSIDTTKPAVAREAARLGAVVVNDIWGLQGDAAMADAVAETESAAVIMHNRRESDASLDIVDELMRFFERSLAIAARAGIPRERLLLDPGIGFGKSLKQNLECIWRLDALRSFDLPVLLGLSRKSLLGKVLDAPPERRLTGTLGANMVGLMRGAAVLRVHDVAEHVEAVKLFVALKASPHG